jgi:RNA polymerase sigma-54 factor
VKPSLRLSVGQHISLTPQLKQAIRLLQLSAVELEQEIATALESNPLLEAGTEQDPDERAAGDDGLDATPEANDQSTDAETNTETREERADDDGIDQFDDDTIDFGQEWERAPGSADSMEPMEARTAAPQSLHDYLRWQLNLTPLSPRDRMVADALIEALDEDGYLREDYDALCADLGERTRATRADIEAVRHRVQQFDPVGIGSRDLRECLLVQLAALPADTAQRELARILVAQHLEALARDADRLAHKLNVGADELATALELVRSLNPRPGNAFGDIRTDYVVPDAYAMRQDGRWRVRLNPSCSPALAINQHYARMAAAARDNTGSYLRGCLQEARWLIKSLRARGETLLKVANCIVRQQSAFLDYGPQAMRPLTLRDVADEVGVHESTVSRITTRKYLHTPRGTFEFKHFFSVGLATAEGGEASATAIRAMIRELVDAENPAKPLSDNAIAAELQQRGIAVARRTVAKYREALNIPSSSERCRLV